MRREAYKPEYTTLMIAMGGCYATAPGEYSSTYNHISIPDGRMTCYFGDVVEGGWVVDKRPCIDREDFVHMVVCGPLLKESLPDGMKLELFSNQPKVCEDAKECSGSDYVSLDLYLKLWRDMGARLGQRKDNEVHWENGEVTDIPNETERYMVDGKIRQEDEWA